MQSEEPDLPETSQTLLDQQVKRGLMRPFEADRLERDARKHWDMFYKRNKVNFFKDRHWTEREFTELDATRWPGECYTILECGCGVGNFIFPLLEQHANVRAFACDFSHRAVDFVNERSAENSLSDRLTAFQADLTSDDLSLNVARESCDLVTMIFVLSAIHPAKFNMTINSLVSVLKPGGKLLFRDYAINDHAMVRFKPGAKIDERMYMRQDGTRSFFFKKEELEELANECGLTVQSIGYCQRATINKKEGIEVKRWFLQATLVKT